MLLNAIYIGIHGNFGFQSNVVYKLHIHKNMPRKVECKSDNNLGVIVEYGNIIDFLSNWKVVTILDM